MKTQLIAGVILFSIAAVGAAQDAPAACQRFDGYLDHRDGTVTDPRTGLTWQLCPSGQAWNGSSCSGVPKQITLKDATLFAFSSRIAGKNDWRLPEREEFLSILEIRPGETGQSDEQLLGKDRATNRYFTAPVGCTETAPFPDVLPSVQIEPASNRVYWTATKIGESDKYIGINFTMMYKKFIGAQLDVLDPASTYRDRGRVVLVRGGKPRGDFGSPFFRGLIKQHEHEVQETARLEKAKMARLSAWRKAKFSIGDDTFCGPIIELRPPMIKLALNAQVQGFGNEAWVKVGDAYPAEYGCRNDNGRLSPLNP